MDSFSLEDLVGMNAAPTRRAFVAYCYEQRGKPYVWAAKGKDLNGNVAFDCSGLVTSGIRAIGGPEMRLMFNAQKLFDASPPVLRGQEQVGDLVFYGLTSQKISHVAIWCALGKAIDACGGDHTTITVAAAKKRDACVMAHRTYMYRNDYIAIHQNAWLNPPTKEAKNG